MVTPHYQDACVDLYQADCLEVLRALPDASVDSVVTDPPYGLANTNSGAVAEALTRWAGGERDFIPAGRGFMGHSWDAFVPPPVVWDECFRVLKPGGFLLCFAGSRTADLMGLSVRLAGFDVRDTIMWIYGNGFPKSLNVSKQCDRDAGLLGVEQGYAPPEPVSDEAKKWRGWGTALKPAHEPIIVARKPFPGTVARNVVLHGTGGLNVDGCRVGTNGGTRASPGAVVRPSVNVYKDGLHTSSGDRVEGLGRWPANVVFDEAAAGMLGGNAKYFYCAKASQAERPVVAGVRHPTVKPLALMRWLVRLVTAPGGVVLDPFAGSGATVEACLLEGFKCVGVEREADYMPLILQRVERVAPLLDFAV